MNNQNTLRESKSIPSDIAIAVESHTKPPQLPKSFSISDLSKMDRNESYNSNIIASKMDNRRKCMSMIYPPIPMNNYSLNRKSSKRNRRLSTTILGPVAMSHSSSFNYKRTSSNKDICGTNNILALSSREEAQKAEERNVAIMNTRIEQAKLVSAHRNSIGSTSTLLTTNNQRLSIHSLPKGVPKRYSFNNTEVSTSKVYHNGPPRRPTRFSSAIFSESYMKHGKEHTVFSQSPLSKEEPLPLANGNSNNTEETILKIDNISEEKIDDKVMKNKKTVIKKIKSLFKVKLNGDNKNKINKLEKESSKSFWKKISFKKNNKEIELAKKKQLKEFNKRMDEHIRGGGDPTKFELEVSQASSTSDEVSSSISLKKENSTSSLSKLSKENLMNSDSSSTSSYGKMTRSITSISLNEQKEIEVQKHIEEFKNMKRQSEQFIQRTESIYKKRSFVFDGNMRSALSSLEASSSSSRIINDPADFELFKKHLIERCDTDYLFGQSVPKSIRMSHRSMTTTSNNYMDDIYGRLSMVNKRSSLIHPPNLNPLIEQSVNEVSLNSNNNQLGIKTETEMKELILEEEIEYLFKKNEDRDTDEITIVISTNESSIHNELSNELETSKKFNGEIPFLTKESSDELNKHKDISFDRLSKNEMRKSFFGNQNIIDYDNKSVNSVNTAHINTNNNIIPHALHAASIASYVN